MATPDRLETSIGTLTMTDGNPDSATAQKIYDNLDRSRALRRPPVGCARAFSGSLDVRCTSRVYASAVGQLPQLNGSYQGTADPLRPVGVVSTRTLVFRFSQSAAWRLNEQEQP